MSEATTDDVTAPPAPGTDRAVDEATVQDLRSKHGFTAAEAMKQHGLLFDVAAKSPVRQTRYEMRRRSREWLRASKALEEWGEDEHTIELLGQIEPGMAVPGPDGNLTIIRKMVQYGQVSLHLEDDNDPRPIYWNYYGNQSPVVIRLMTGPAGADRAALVTYLEVLSMEYLTLEDPVAVADAIQALEDVGEVLKNNLSILKSHAVAVLKGHELRTVDATTGRRMKLSTTVKRTGWDRPAIIANALAIAPTKRILNSTTGEAETEAQAAVRILGEMVSLGAGKVRGLEAYGLDPDEFCEKVPGGTTVEWA